LIFWNIFVITLRKISKSKRETSLPLYCFVWINICYNFFHVLQFLYYNVPVANVWCFIFTIHQILAEEANNHAIIAKHFSYTGVWNLLLFLPLKIGQDTYLACEDTRSLFYTNIMSQLLKIYQYTKPYLLHSPLHFQQLTRLIILSPHQILYLQFYNLVKIEISSHDCKSIKLSK
jgi:hypothetical protein